MATQTVTALPKKQHSQTKSNARMPRGEAFDLRGRQHRIAREQNDWQESEDAKKQNEELLGRRLVALSEKYKHQDDGQQEGKEDKRRKSRRGVTVPLFGGGGGVKVDTEGVQFRSNEEVLPMRRYPKAPQKQQTQRRRPAEATYDGTAAEFGPSLCKSGPAPKPPVIWGPGMNPPSPPKNKEREPTENAAPVAATIAVPTPAAPVVTTNYAAMAAKPPTTLRPQTPNHLPPTIPLADSTPTNDVWGAETDNDDDDDDDDDDDLKELKHGRAWGSL